MHRNSLRALLVAILVGGAAPAVSQLSDVPPFRLEDKRLAEVVGAFNEERESRQWGRTKVELKKLLESGSPDLQNLSSWWIGVQPGLSDNERIQFWQMAIEVVPKERDWTGAAMAIMRLELRNAPKKERLEIYRAAMEKGSVRLTEGAELGRREACGLAAYDGILELKDLVEKYLYDLPGQPSGLKATALVAIELRRDAENRKDALRLQVQRMAEMPRGEMTRRMWEQQGFAGAKAVLEREIREGNDSDLKKKLTQVLIVPFDICEEEKMRPSRVDPAHRDSVCAALVTNSAFRADVVRLWTDEQVKKGALRRGTSVPASQEERP